MIDAEKILADLQKQASDIARDLDVETRIDDAKEAAGKVRTRLETDPQARNVAAGAGGLLLLGLLGSRGGRRLIGGVAKTGAVAALGAVAYKAWNERRGETAGDTPSEFLTDAKEDPEFVLAIIRAMIAGAYADGTLSTEEENLIRKAIDDGDLDAEAQALLLNDTSQQEDLAHITAAATTPNRAAQLYAAAAMAADAENNRNTNFLEMLADRLGLEAGYAMALRNAS